MVEIHLYGKLRRYAKDNPADLDTVIRVSVNSNETLMMLLARLEIPVDEIYSIFLNSKLLAARTGMARWIGFQIARSELFDWNLNVTIKSGDRIGLFGRDMAALVI